MKTTPEQLDGLRELINIGIGRSAGLLNEMLGAHIDLYVPQVEVLAADQVEKAMSHLDRGLTTLVHLDFRGSFNGTASLVFTRESAEKLVGLLTGESAGKVEFDEIKESALTEIGNIVINGVMGSIGNILDRPMSYSIPTYIEQDDALRGALAGGASHDVVVLGHAQFRVTKHMIRGEILLVFDIGSFESFLAALDASNVEKQLV